MKTYITIADGIKYTVVVGQNKHENWRLIDDADPDDFWFHANGSPSAHVLLYAPENGIVPLSIITFCSEKTCHRDVIYTNISNIRKGKHIGEAIIIDQQLLRRNVMKRKEIVL